jgi:DNA-binding response OmpR family regulator
MPDMDGFEVLEELKKKEPSVKAMMITGRDDKDSQEKARKLGAHDYIVKPLDLEELHKKIYEHILAK